MHALVDTQDTDQAIQENGVATAVEAIYRDLEYARSLIKKSAHADHRDTDHADHTAIHRPRTPRTLRSPRTGRNSSDSTHHDGGATSDWSVISDQED